MPAAQFFALMERVTAEAQQLLSAMTMGTDEAFEAMLEQVLEEVHRDAEILDCVDEIEHCRSIVGSGTSADRQLAVFEKAQGSSDDRTNALRAVTDWLAEATLQ